MKITKKVGRRKHNRRFSISRRIINNNKNKKSSYKKRYAKTHKVGKRARGEKRMRTRTHKRGKRFHKGGEGKPINCNFTETNGNYELNIPKNQTLFVKKNGELVQGRPSQEFNVKLSVKTGKKIIQDISSMSKSSTPTQFLVTFSRTTLGRDGKNVSFNISDLSYFTEPTKQQQQQTQRSSVPNEKYDFSDTKNSQFFTDIEKCIKQQLQKQKQELKAYYEEVKDLLEHCKIVILSSVEIQSANVTLTGNGDYNSSFNAWSGLNLTPKPPFFSFLFFVYVDTSGNIDIDKTKKLVELLSSLSNYGLFFLQKTNGQPYTENDSPLTKLRNFMYAGNSSMLKKITDSVGQCSSLIGMLSSPDSLTITSDMVSLVKSIEDLRSSGIGNSSQSLLIPTDKIWEVFTKIKNSPNSDSFVDLTRSGGLTLQNLTAYVDSNTDFLPKHLADDEQRSEFKKNYLAEIQKPSSNETKKQTIAKRESEVDDVITQLGENIEAHPNDKNSKVKSYSEFKAQQESNAEELKKQIDGLQIDDTEKQIRKANVDFYLKKILETQLDYMKRRYRAFYIYQDFPEPNESSTLIFTSNESGLYDKDKDYVNYDNVGVVLNKLENNVAAFQFRIEKQAENPVSDEYLDLVSTSTDEPNYETLFKQCSIFSTDSNGNPIGNAPKCYESLKYTASMAREVL